MKINRVSQKDHPKISWKNSFFMNIYYFFCFYRLLASIIIGLAFSILLFLIVMDLMIPSQLSSIDYKTTLKLFDQLQQANRHQDAINLMEYKGKILDDSPEEIVYKSRLADSYYHVGDYSKAEKMYLDIWNLLPKFIKEYGDSEDADVQFSKQALYYATARIIYLFYEKIGDVNNQLKFYHIYKKYYDGAQQEIDRFVAKAYNEKEWFSTLDIAIPKELIQYDSIVVSYYQNKELAIRSMGKYVDKTLGNQQYPPRYKVKCLNQLIKWDFENGKEIDAYPRILQAVDQIKQMNVLAECEDLGELSDYCFRIHDLSMSKVLFKKYQKFLDRYHDKNDYEYIVNYVRGFRFQEAEGDWDGLISDLQLYCEGMKKQIALNIPSMTEEQREHFAQQFDVAYNYAFHVLQKHPTPELANLCFDNITFKTGLLLRSNLSIRHSIENMRDPEILKKYNELGDLRKNLSYQEISGKKLFNQKDEIQKKIDDIEKELALKCTDFKTKNELENQDYHQVQKSLDSGEALVNLVENEGQLFALMLKHKGDVSYIPMGKLADIQSQLQRPIFEIYHDPGLTQKLLGKVLDAAAGIHTLYYVPKGIYNQIAVGALYMGNNKYVCDTRQLKLLANPMDIKTAKPFNLSAISHGATLWGGIDYGPGSATLPALKRQAIKRGETLSNLPYAYNEVMDISALFRAKNVRNRVYTGKYATEAAFKSRSKMKNSIIHISTHGFFKDNAPNKNPMLESGLFFAGANRYWCNDTLQLSPYADDGILRSAEIATLNLADCSLVVLSACETGLGYSNSSEGVYGLQRAFKLAGAKQILMSLWAVDDRATDMLMTGFYQGLLRGEDADEALQKSKAHLRKMYPSPEDWGAFVLLH